MRIGFAPAVAGFQVANAGQKLWKVIFTLVYRHTFRMHAWKYFQQSDREGWLRFLRLQAWPAWTTIHLLECWEILSFQGVWCGERHSWKTSMWQVGAVYSRQRRTLSRSMSVLSVRVLLPKAQ
jgi:hypothetical protein